MIKFVLGFIFCLVLLCLWLAWGYLEYRTNRYGPKK